MCSKTQRWRTQSWELAAVKTMWHNPADHAWIVFTLCGSTTWVCPRLLWRGLTTRRTPHLPSDTVCQHSIPVRGRRGKSCPEFPGSCPSALRSLACSDREHCVSRTSLGRIPHNLPQMSYVHTGFLVLAFGAYRRTSVSLTPLLLFAAAATCRESETSVGGRQGRRTGMGRRG